ncbi:NADP-dependent alcohol dehydrogenase 6 [Cytospora mali]|uniref:NADP-dependent alcohol dehydrogenase 6 n=1 Tax=Cytospora mali TaxID=578113 RepID=A0A194VUY4_CYTMA|nr:NADP-dependent alcohol dehydrogenase 6 [Valsa mali]
MSATTQTSSGIKSATGILSLTGSAVEADNNPQRAPLTRDEAVGFQVDSPDTWTDFHKRVHKLKPQGDYDVDIQILACGVCGSDVHTLCGGWGDQHYPLVVGHEIIGLVTRTGPKVTLHKIGDRVGVGASSWACLECRQCKRDNEQYCPHQLDTYGAEWPGTGYVTKGGYSSHVRIHEHYCFPVPAALPTNVAAPMMCAGLTVYSPLKRNGCGPNRKVGVVGVGGLGHLAVMFAKAMGAEVWAFMLDHSLDADARELGAEGVIVMSEEGVMEEHKRTFDLILNSASSAVNCAPYLPLLDVNGRWIAVSMPAKNDKGTEVSTWTQIENGCLIGASHLGSRKEALEMLQLAADKGVRTWIEEIDISKEGLKTAIERCRRSDVRYRFCLTGFDKEFGEDIKDREN